MPWETQQDRVAFVTRTATTAVRAAGLDGSCIDAVVQSALQTDSPIEAIFAAWFVAARDHLLARGYSRFMLQLRPQAWVTIEPGLQYRLDFALEPLDPTVREALERHGIPLKVGIELDGHAYHERTREQVILRNRRDRDFIDRHWQIRHYSGSELHSNPIFNVVEVLVAGADALDQAKAALLHE